MKFAAKVKIDIKKGFLPYFTNEVYKRGCGIRNIELCGTGIESEIFQIEVFYPAPEKFDSLLKKISAYENNFRIISSENMIEKEVLNGMLNLSGTTRLNDLLDYNINLLGAADVLSKMYSRDQGAKKYPGILKNIALLCAVTETNAARSNYLDLYISAEKDSVIVSKFAGLNAFPLIVSMNQFDDFINVARRLENTFSAFRICNLEDIEDPSLFKRFCGDVRLPTLTRFYDEIPLYLLIAVLHMLNKNKIDLLSSTVGIVGINVSSMRIAKLLLAMGARRVIGSDNTVALMHNFERQGGFALTRENIFSNSDIIILIKDQYEDTDLNMTGSGQIVISMTDREFDEDLLKKRGVRDFLQSGWMENSCLFPGILKGMIENGIKNLDDSRLIVLAKKITALKSGDEVIPGIFSDIHNTLAVMLREL